MHSRHRDKTIELLDVDASALFYGQTLSSNVQIYFSGFKKYQEKRYYDEKHFEVESTTTAIQGGEWLKYKHSCSLCFILVLLYVSYGLRHTSAVEHCSTCFIPATISVMWTLPCRVGIQIRNMKIVFSIYGTWRWVTFETLMMKIYDFFLFG